MWVELLPKEEVGEGSKELEWLPAARHWAFVRGRVRRVRRVRRIVVRVVGESMV
jgi:hypothetical protein